MWAEPGRGGPCVQHAAPERAEPTGGSQRQCRWWWPIAGLCAGLRHGGEDGPAGRARAGALWRGSAHGRDAAETRRGPCATWSPPPTGGDPRAAKGLRPAGTWPGWTGRLPGWTQIQQAVATELARRAHLSQRAGDRRSPPTCPSWGRPRRPLPRWSAWRWARDVGRAGLSRHSGWAGTTAVPTRAAVLSGPAAARQAGQSGPSRRDAQAPAGPAGAPRGSRNPCPPPKSP